MINYFTIKLFLIHFLLNLFLENFLLNILWIKINFRMLNKYKIHFKKLLKHFRLFVKLFLIHLKLNKNYRNFLKITWFLILILSSWIKIFFYLFTRKFFIIPFKLSSAGWSWNFFRNSTSGRHISWNTRRRWIGSEDFRTHH